MIKTLNTLGTEGNFSNLIKGICRKRTAAIMLSGWKSMFPPEIRNKTRLPTPSAQCCIGGTGHLDKKRHLGWKGRSTVMSICRWCNLRYSKLPKENKAITDDELNRVAGYKLNIQTSVVFLYSRNEQSENELQKIVPFTMTSKGIKYFGIGSIKEV